MSRLAMRKMAFKFKCNVYLGRHKVCSHKQCPANLNAHYKDGQMPNGVLAGRYSTPVQEEKRRKEKSIQSKDIRQSGKQFQRCMRCHFGYQPKNTSVCKYIHWHIFKIPRKCAVFYQNLYTGMSGHVTGRPAQRKNEWIFFFFWPRC